MTEVPPRRAATAVLPLGAGDAGRRVPSLFDIAVLYVGKNLLHVESFVGFPAAMTAKLFDAAVRCGAFGQADAATSAALAKLADAYGEDFASSLNLSGLSFDDCRRNARWPAGGRDAAAAATAAAALFANVTACRCLTSLDLGCCGLGESEPLFSLARDCLVELHSLTGLGLRSNSLDDKHLWSLTRPAAVLETGLVALERLDLADNNLTVSAVKHLLALRRLRVVWLSGNFISKHVYEERCAALPYRPEEGQGQRFRVDTLGWGLSPFERWATAARDGDRPADAARELSSFYSSSSASVGSSSRHRRSSVGCGLSLTLVREHKDDDARGVRSLSALAAPRKKPRLTQRGRELSRADTAEYFAAYT